MKKIILTIAIAISTIVVFAADSDNVNAKVLSSFTSEFGHAKDVQWTAGADLYKANFVFNSNYVTAFFSADGTLLGVTRNISSLDLPLNLQAGLQKTYKNYWITDLFELSNENGTEYYITVENADGKVTLKSGLSGSWSTFRKSVKI